MKLKFLSEHEICKNILSIKNFLSPETNSRCVLKNIEMQISRVLTRGNEMRLKL